MRNRYQSRSLSILVGLAIIIIIALVVVAIALQANADSAVCFNQEKDYKQFLAKNENETGYTLMFPCPADSLLNQSFGKDESNK